MRLWEHSSNLDWLVTILGVGQAESDPNVLQEKCSWFCNRYLWGFGVLLLARGARASKTGLRAATEIFYGWYQGALQDSEMNQTFLPIARIAKGIIWYSKKWKKKKRTKRKKRNNTMNKQRTASMLLGIKCPSTTGQDHLPRSAFLTRGCRFLMLPPKICCISQNPQQETDRKGRSPHLRSDASYSKESSSIPAPS